MKSGRTVAQELVLEVEKAIEGKREVVTLAVTALLARGHLLIEDVPGVGKTTLARALASAVGVPFRRIQFTSDLLPADVLGGSLYDPKNGTLEFRPGPVFTSVLLADEVNRTTPRTQSALLEAMDERAVSIEGETRPLPEPFFVVATQNPEEFHGTYPLPESQLDRFLLRVAIGHPPAAVERKLLRERGASSPIDAVRPVVSRDELLGAQREVDEVRVDDVVLDYVHEIVLGTRKSPLLSLGASTRAALALARGIRAHALALGRTFATPDDVKALAVPALAHRVRPREMPGDRAVEREVAARAVREIVDAIPVPI
ncbi:MAG: MoxR family ATPase [Sandaracinus sp.]